MDFARIIEFAGNHPILIVAFLGTLGALLYTEISSPHQWHTVSRTG